jgi:hypothetical protein
MTEAERQLIERENQMQQFSIDILNSSNKIGITMQDVAIVFGGIIRHQANVHAESLGVTSQVVAEELIRKFMEGLRGTYEGPTQRH